MTAYHAATGRLANQMESGIRAFDIGKDLRPVAELIADAFAQELDPRGTAALREMRIMSHIGAILKLLNRSTGEFDDLFGGFVWIEENKLVGNVTVQRADPTGSRWQIANVAVAPPYRGRGISRNLMATALEHVGANGGQWAVLQVYAQNTIARRLYERFDFEVVGGSVELKLERTPVVEATPALLNFYSFSPDQWQPLYDLVSSQQNAQMQWWRTPKRSEFQVTFEQMVAEWFWRTLGKNKIYRRCIQRAHSFDAALVLTAAYWRGAHELQLWVRPERYGQYEAPLLHWTLATLQNYPRWPIRLTLSTEHQAAIDAALQYGFRAQHTLLTMRRKI